MEPNERARAGIFLAFQRPMAIPGVKMADFLRHAATNVRRPDRKEGEELIPMREFRKELNAKMEQLRMDQEFARRYVNDGFSGGEMKRAEILQLAMLRPKFAILDETDSGLDVDAVRLASQSIAEIGGARHGHSDHHASRTTAGTQPARLHPRDARRPDRRNRRPGTGRWNCTSKATTASARAYPTAAADEAAMLRQDSGNGDAGNRRLDKARSADSMKAGMMNRSATPVSMRSVNRQSSSPTIRLRNIADLSWLPISIHDSSDVGSAKSISTISAPTRSTSSRARKGLDRRRSSSRSRR